MDNMYTTISVFLFVFATAFCAVIEDLQLGSEGELKGERARENELEKDRCNKKMMNSTCIRVISCPYVLKLLDARDIETLAKLRCGFEGTHPKACCPKGEVPIVYNITEEIATNRPKPASTSKPRVTTSMAPRVTEPMDTTFPSKALCGKNSGGVVDRIVGGTITGIREHPWLARIGYRIESGNVFGCSASLITDRYLLTAAHCVVKNIPIGVRLGEWNAKTHVDCYNDICNNKTIDIKISKIIAHPSSNISRGADGDIALIQLEEPVTFSEFIQPVCLPTTEYIAMQDYSRDSVYFTAGWGQTEFESESDVKRQVQLKAAPIEVCRNLFHLKAESEPNIICAGGTKGKDTCRGDSGGPLVKLLSEDYDYNWYLFGITSLGSPNCGAEGVPGMYTRVSVYMNWIRAVVSS